MPELPKTLKTKGGKKITRARKYATQSSRWRKIRLAQLNREPLCRHCKEQGITKAANEVDHINNDSWNNTPDNLQSLCKPCHTRKTNREDGGLGGIHGRQDAQG